MSISIWSILVVILMLGLLVTIHELGHFWAACLLRIKAYEVSIFVGPKLVSWNRKGVDYSIRCLPFGAYVRFTEIAEDGTPVQSDDPAELINQPRWKRLLVALAGPFMNMVLGIILFVIFFSVSGFYSLEIGTTYKDTQLYGQEYEVGDKIVAINGHPVYTYLDFFYEMNDAKPTQDMTITLRDDDGDKYDLTLVPEIYTRPMLGITHWEGTDNEYNGWEIIEVNELQNNGDPVLKPGDYLTEVDGYHVDSEEFFEYFNNLSEGEPMLLTYYRDGEIHEDECSKTMITGANDRGVRITRYEVDSPSVFLKALGYSAKMPLTIVNVSIKSIGDVFDGEEEVYNMVSGPVGVTSVVSEVVDDKEEETEDKVTSIIMLAAVISIGLMFTNMLPIPGLDGVQVILIVVEMILGRKLSEKSENMINIVGFFILVGLVIFAFASDIIRIIKGG